MAKHYILVDADFIDTLAFDFIVLAERELQQRVLQGNLSLWLDCIALDGGLRPDKNEIQVAFLHEKDTSSLKNFTPSNFISEINGKAFRDNLGEFCLATYSVEEMVTKSEFFVQSLEVLLEGKEKGKLMLVPNMQAYGSQILKIIENSEADITLFVTEIIPSLQCKQEYISYSVAHALGVTS